MSVGGSDARHLARVGVPAILTHPFGGAQHANEEWIDKQGVMQFRDVVADYLETVAKHGENA
jgi:acetylornithine deacetylase/succinyl-diaminopimelate desuccinylase-like protein